MLLLLTMIDSVDSKINIYCVFLYAQQKDYTIIIVKIYNWLYNILNKLIYNSNKQRRKRCQETI